MMRKIFDIVFSITVALILIISNSFGQSELSQEDKKLQLYTAVNICETLPDYSWVLDINGDTTRYQDFKNKWLVVDYWSVTCKPCISEIPYYDKRSDAYRYDNVLFISISMDKKRRTWEKRQKKFNIRVPSFHIDWDSGNPFFWLNLTKYSDNKGNIQFRSSYPKYMLISPQGEIIHKDLPLPSSNDFVKVLNQLMADN